MGTTRVFARMDIALSLSAVNAFTLGGVCVLLICCNIIIIIITRIRVCSYTTSTKIRKFGFARNYEKIRTENTETIVILSLKRDAKMSMIVLNTILTKKDDEKNARLWVGQKTHHKTKRYVCMGTLFREKRNTNLAAVLCSNSGPDKGAYHCHTGFHPFTYLGSIWCQSGTCTDSDCCYREIKAFCLACQYAMGDVIVP